LFSLGIEAVEKQRRIQRSENAAAGTAAALPKDKV
jgi:hypothetical protein